MKKFLIILSSLGVLLTPMISFGAASEFFSTPLYATSSMVGYWRFESGSNYTGAGFTGSDTSMSYSTGKFGNAAIFNGSTSRIAMTATTLTDFTVSFWGKQNGTSGGSQVFQNFSNASDNGNQDSYIETSSNYLRGSLWNGSSGTNLASGVSVNDSAWHHWAVTRSGSNYTVYLDGVQTATTGSGLTVTIGNLWELGRNRPNNNSYCNCALDDLIVFNVALSSTTVSYLANGFPSNPTSSTSSAPIVINRASPTMPIVMIGLLLIFIVWISRRSTS